MPGVERAERIEVALPTGVVAVSVLWDEPDAPWAVTALAPGAGADCTHPFLEGAAGALREHGIAVVRFDFPYRAAGRRMPGPAAHAVAAWRAIGEVVGERMPQLPFVAAGKSYGGRMASMAVAEGALDPRALVHLGYPLHPPGRPERPRASHLPYIGAPQLFLSGTRDPFVDPHSQLEEAVASCRDASIAWVEGAGHSFEVAGRRTPALEVGAGIAQLVAGWLRVRLG